MKWLWWYRSVNILQNGIICLTRVNLTVHEPYLNRALKRALPSCAPTHHTDSHAQYISDSFGVPPHLAFPL